MDNPNLIPNDDSRISGHFLFSETYHTKLKQFIDENRAYAATLTDTTKHLAADLEIIRAGINLPLIVSSWVRCPALNAAVGSRPTSEHLRGTAVDFTGPRGSDLEKIYKWIWRQSGLLIGQLILETTYTTWIHYSLGEPFRPKEKCRQFLVYRHGAYLTAEQTFLHT